MAGLTLATSASAIDFKKNTAYRIVSTSYPNATICVGEQHWTQPYLFSNADYKGECKDSWWYFEKQNDGSYAIYNADTKQYITYSQQRISGVCKGLELTDMDTGEASHWFVEEYANGQCLVYTLASNAVDKGDNYWNQRINGSDNYLLGTYNYATGANSLFLFTTEGYVAPDPGPGPDVPDPKPEVPTYTVVDGGPDFYAVGQTGNRLTIVPKDYVETYEIKDHTVTLTLGEDFYTVSEPLSTPSEGEVSNAHIVFEQVNFFDLNALPDDAQMPTFTSYKFNNKFNYQLYTDAEAADPTASEISIPVAGIGKWLTASFQFSHEGAAAYIGDVRQQSKVTRQRFGSPLTYTVGYPTWRKMEIRAYDDPANSADELTLVTAYVPYGTEQTVSVEWLTDKMTTDYGVPRIDILLTDHSDAKWGSGGWGGWGDWDTEYFWLGQNGKTHYENAEITIDGGGAFPNMEATPILIKGRGNSTWASSSSSKNPYHFKFESGQKPLGLTKGKHWVLLSNKQTGSMTSNAIGHRVAEMMGGVAPCHIVPVELYINGSYRGSYNLCEKVGFGNNCIDIDDETNAGMVELDTYTDETIYHDDWYYLSTKMKEPDFDSSYEGPLRPEDIMSDWEELMQRAYYGEDIAPYVDVDRLAAYLAANEAICNCELKHAKSCFAYSENVLDGFNIKVGADETPWVFGPLWDCDWAFGYEQRKSYFQTSQTEDFFGYLISGGDSGGRAKNMWNALRNCPEVNKAYYYKWYDFTNNRLAELVDFCDEYYAFARQSLDHNTQNEANERDGSNYEMLTAYAKQWLQQRAQHVLSSLETYPLPVEPVEPDPVYDDPTGPIRGTLAGTIVGIDVQLAGTSASDAPVYDLQGRRATTTTSGVTLSQKRKVVK